MGHHIPLMLSKDCLTSKMDYNRPRRMSVPAVPLALQLGKIGLSSAGIKLGNSVETII